MAKTQKIISLVLIIVCIFLVFILKSRYDEGFYSGDISNQYLYPLVYQMPYIKTQDQSQSNNQVQNQIFGNLNLNQPIHSQQYQKPSRSFQGPSNPMYYYGPNLGSSDSDSTLYQQPLMYPNQMYPKIPWAPKSGQACTVGQCGAAASCVDGVCKQNQINQTVFGIDVI